MNTLLKLLILTIPFVFPVLSFAHGLKFNDVRTATEPKTSYSVLSKRKPVFSGTFSMTFDMAVCDYRTFGYVFRIRDYKDPSADVYNFFFSYNDDFTSFLKFNIEGKENRITHTLSNDHLGSRQWFRVKILFDMDNDLVSLLVEDRYYVTRNVMLPQSMSPDITFGSSQYSEDTPSFELRNVIIEGQDAKASQGVKSKKLTYYFPLNESKGNAVHDSLHRVSGETINPIWLVNESFHWKKRFSMASKSVAAVNYDQQKSQFLILNKDSLVTFSPLDDRQTVMPYNSPMPMDMALGMSFIDYPNNQIYTYEVNNLPVDAITIASLDLNTLKWKPVSDTYLSTQRHQHSATYDSVRREFLIFGGFGNRQYSNQFMVYDIDRNRWREDKFEGDIIAPRFFSSMGNLSNGELLIFGGTGNKSGDQTVGRFNFYDLYKVDPIAKKSVKLWDVKPELDYVPVRNMVVSDDQKSFYTMMFKVHEPYSHLKMGKYSIETGDCVIVGDSMPIVSDAITTNATLYFDDRTSEFYCCVQEFENGGTASTIVIYSLAAPAVAESVLSMYDSVYSWSCWWICVIIVSILCILYIFWYRMRIHKRSVLKNNEGSIQAMSEMEYLDDEDSNKSNAIYLFGDFKVLNRDGRDISYMFGNKIKQMFLLILLRSEDEYGGVSSANISEMLWPEKTIQQAKNIKGVTMNHLRKIIADIDGIKLSFKNNLFRIDIDSTCYCDYVEFIKSVRNIKSGHSNMSNVDFSRLRRDISRGEFLKGMDGELTDNQKRIFEERAIELFTVMLDRKFREKQYKEVAEISELLFSVDQLSDVALWYQVNAMNKMRDTESARKRYYLFTIRYNKTMGQNYRYSFDNMLVISLNDVL